jgi:hypothetical protein
MEGGLLAFLFDNTPEAVYNAIVPAIKSTGFDHFILALELVIRESPNRNCSKMNSIASKC